MKLLFLALLALCAGVWWTSRQHGRQARTVRGKQRSGERRSEVQYRKPWRAVSIRPGDDACEDAAALARQRFLLADAPLTPLAGCTARRCSCRYDHHNDRRSRMDRRALSPMRRSDDERRVNSGRREEDRGY